MYIFKLFIHRKYRQLFSTGPTMDNCYISKNKVDNIVRDEILSIKKPPSFDSFISHYYTDNCHAFYFYNKDISDKVPKKVNIKIKIKIAINVYRTSFSEVLNL